MREITFTVPCYNSEDYMERCIDSLLAGDECVEVIIVDDGSTDGTGEIADNYARNYPEVGSYAAADSVIDTAIERLQNFMNNLG